MRRGQSSIRVLFFLQQSRARGGGGDGGRRDHLPRFFHPLLPFLFPFDAFDVVVDPIPVRVFPEHV